MANEQNSSRYSTKDYVSPAEQKEVAQSLQNDRIAQMCYPDNMQEAVNFVIALIVLSSYGYWFKFGNSKKEPVPMLTIFEPGRGADYRPFRSVQEFDELVFYLQDLLRRHNAR